MKKWKCNTKHQSQPILKNIGFDRLNSVWVGGKYVLNKRLTIIIVVLVIVINYPKASQRYAFAVWTMTISPYATIDMFSLFYHTSHKTRNTSLHLHCDVFIFSNLLPSNYKFYGDFWILWMPTVATLYLLVEFWKTLYIWY